jgi:hypothetical protein
MCSEMVRKGGGGMYFKIYPEEGRMMMEYLRTAFILWMLK